MSKFDECEECELYEKEEAVRMWNIRADRKTEPTISKMEQVDRDINVRSKTEPQTNADQHVQDVGSVGSVEQTERSEDE